MAILLGILPSITAHKGIAGRAKVVKAFEQYLHNDGHKEGSVWMKNRYELSAGNGVSLEDIARFEVGGAVAILVNTAPAVFWMLFLVYSHPGLLDELRNEVDALVTSNPSDKGLVRSLDITTLKQNCPLLTSTFQEVLRYRSMGTSVREVMEDTVLDGKWLLKKNCMIQMPSRVIHKDNSIWGSDVDEFNPRRFMKDELGRQTVEGDQMQRRSGHSEAVRLYVQVVILRPMKSLRWWRCLSCGMIWRLLQANGVCRPPRTPMLLL